jgi:hypothetical protein
MLIGRKMICTSCHGCTKHPATPSPSCASCAAKASSICVIMQKGTPVNAPAVDCLVATAATWTILQTPCLVPQWACVAVMMQCVSSAAWGDARRQPCQAVPWSLLAAATLVCNRQQHPKACAMPVIVPSLTHHAQKTTARAPLTLAAASSDCAAAAFASAAASCLMRKLWGWPTSDSCWCSFSAAAWQQAAKQKTHSLLTPCYGSRTSKMTQVQDPRSAFFAFFSAPCSLHPARKRH